MTLADLPTPVGRLERLGAAVGLGELWIKRDDLTAPLVGGNKVRKLEFLLADARSHGARTVVAIGATGSNHVVATTYYARALGLATVALLLDQPNATYVRRNLLLAAAWGARQLRCRTALELALRSALLRVSERGAYAMPLGGSSPLGTLGYVNAALELVSQVEGGELPRPAAVFVATGSTGTQAGLLLGFALAGLEIPVFGVPVSERRVPWQALVSGLCNATARLLRRRSAGAPIPRIQPSAVRIVPGHVGAGYGHFTAEGLELARLARDLEGLSLDGTYTAKALAGAVAATPELGLQRRPILFWHSLGSGDLESVARGISPAAVPAEFVDYFARPVQELDPEA